MRRAASRQLGRGSCAQQTCCAALIMSVALDRATSRHARPKSSANCVSTLARRGPTARLGRAAAGTLVLKPGVPAAARVGAALVAAAFATIEAAAAD